MLLSAVSSGAGAAVSRIFTPGRDPMLLTGWQLFLGGLVLYGISAAGVAGWEQSACKAFCCWDIWWCCPQPAFTIWTALLGKFPIGRSVCSGS